MMVFIFLIWPFEQNEKDISSYSEKYVKEMVKEIPENKRVVVANFVNLKGEETWLGVYLGKKFSGILSSYKKIKVVDRELGKKVFAKESKYSIKQKNALDILKKFQTDYILIGRYLLKQDCMEIIELKLMSSDGSEVFSSKSFTIPLDKEEIKEFREIEKMPLETTSDTTLSFLTIKGEGKGIKEAYILNKYNEKLKVPCILYPGDYIKIGIEFYETGGYLYIFGWDTENHIVTLLHPSIYNPDPLVKERIVKLPSQDTAGFVADTPPGYNWIKIIYTHKKLKSLSSVKERGVISQKTLNMIDKEIQEFDASSYSTRLLEIWIRAYKEEIGGAK